MCRETVLHKPPARRKPRPVQFADARGQHPTSLYCECTYTNPLGAAGGKKCSGESWAARALSFSEASSGRPSAAQVQSNYAQSARAFAMANTQPFATSGINPWG